MMNGLLFFVDLPRACPKKIYCKKALISAETRNT